MKLARLEIENYRAIERLELPLNSDLTVFHGDNAHGKTSILSAIAVGLGSIPRFLPGVSSIGFLKTDLRGQKPLRVALTTIEGVRWRRRMSAGGAGGRVIPQRELKEVLDAIVSADKEGSEPHELPIVAFYDTDRAVFDAPQRRRGFKPDFPRYGALEGALSVRTNFREFFQWFYAMENEELRAQRQQPFSGNGLKELDTVRSAITAMMPGVTQPRIKFRPLRFVVTVESERGEPEELSLDQLSGGYRIMLALAADLARRMAQGNPHLDDPLTSEAIVLIDEVELHLHPSWQQRVLTDLARTFPNTQFIVSTHSPQVLTTVSPDHIVRLRREGDSIVAEQESVATATYGAEAGDVLSTVMGVDERPGGNEFVNALRDYMVLVGNGRGESEEAVSLRQKLESLSPRDPALDRADIEIRRRKLLKDMGKSR